MSADDKDRALREHLLYLLRGGGAHIKFEEALKDFPAELFNRKAAGTTYTPWQLLEHMRIAQWDILEFSRSAAHVSPKWPEGYWPEERVEADEDEWRRSVERFSEDLRADGGFGRRRVERPLRRHPARRRGRRSCARRC